MRPITATRVALLIVCPMVAAFEPWTCPGTVIEGGDCESSVDCVDGLACCEQCDGFPIGSCRAPDDCCPEPEPACAICGDWRQRYSCSLEATDTNCTATNACVHEDLCSELTFARGDEAGTYVTTDGFLVGTLADHTLTWIGVKEDDDNLPPDIGYHEVGVWTFNADFTALAGMSCYVFDDEFAPEPGATDCAPAQGDPPWQAEGVCSAAAAVATKVPGPPADVGCCTDAPAQQEGCGP